MMRKIIAFAVVLTIMFCLLVLSATIMLSDSRALVEEISEKDPTALINAKELLKKTLLQVKTANTYKKVVFSHQQIELLTSYLSQVLPYINTRYNSAHSEAIFAATVNVPKVPINRFINISTELINNQNLLEGTTSVGSIRLSNESFADIMLFISGLFVDEQIIEIIDFMLRHASFDNKNITLLIPDFNYAQLSSLLKADLRELKSLVWSNQELEGIDHYYELLLNISSYFQGISNVSLVEYIKPLFIEARQQSHLKPPEQENFKALLALSLFTGDFRLKQIISQITNYYPLESIDTSNITLATRKDLMLHFIYSSTLQILSNDQVSFTIGEAKEVLDMSHSGSGFSFADLAFDLAGNRFALLATKDAKQARHLQSFISKTTSEKDIVPDLFLLEENIGLEDFKQNYKNTDSNEYLAIVSEIDRRIQQLPLFESIHIQGENLH